MNINDLKPGPIRHAQLSPELVLRVETVYSALAGVFPMSRDEWIDGLRRDLNPEQEIVWWERLASFYLDLTTRTKLSASQQRVAFKIIFGILSGLSAEDLAADLAKLPESALTELAAVLRSKPT